MSCLAITRPGEPRKILQFAKFWQNFYRPLSVYLVYTGNKLRIRVPLVSRHLM